MKTERLEAQSWRGDLRSYGFDDKIDESLVELETRVKLESRMNIKVWSLTKEEGSIQYREN